MDEADIVRDWAWQEIRPWLGEPLSSAVVHAELKRLNATEPNIFLLSIENGRAELLEKPVAARHAFYNESRARALLYQDWISKTIELELPKLKTTLGIFVGDGALDAPRVPVFSFQKPDKNRCLLLPDVELLEFPQYLDPISYWEKSCTAIFAGSTSGGKITTEALKRDGAIPRIRSFIFFRDKPNVDFRLPSLVQYDTPETAQLLRDVGIGDGNIIHWSDQVKHRFVISMDGNGATCSRVILALSSNSVLLKYASTSLLYYFRGLHPWRHFIPIFDDTDVVTIVQNEMATPGLYESIAECGQNFNERFLNHNAVMRYTAELLRIYASCVDDTLKDALNEAPADDKAEEEDVNSDLITDDVHFVRWSRPIYEQVEDGDLSVAFEFAKSEELRRRDIFLADTIDPAIAPFAEMFTSASQRNYKTPRMLCTVIPGGSVLVDDGLIYDGAGVLADCMYSVDDWRSESMIEQIDRSSGIQFNRPLNLHDTPRDGSYYCGFTGNWRNFGHWISECLPRLYLFRGLQHYVPGVKLLLPEFSSNSIQSQTLELVGIQESEIQRVRAGTVFRATALWVSSAIHVWGLPTLCRDAANWLRTPVTDNTETGNRSPYVYIHRQSEFRRLLNFDDLKPVLTTFGFRIVQMEDLRLAEQINLMRHARVVIGESSSGLVNTIFCNPGTRILELFTPASAQPAHWVIASICDLEYGYLVGEHCSTDLFPLPQGNSAYQIPVAKLKEAIWRLLSEDRPKVTCVATPVAPWRRTDTEQNSSTPNS